MSRRAANAISFAPAFREVLSMRHDLARAALACLLAIATVAALPAAPARGQDAARFRAFLESGGDVTRALRPLAEKTSDSVVRIRTRGRTVGLGIVVDADGLILAKASSVPAKANCRVADGRSYDARVVAVDDAWDLALLQIDAKGLAPAILEEAPRFGLGRWMVSVGTTRDPLGVGVVSVLPRTIAPRRGFLGVELDDARTGVGVRVNDVVRGSAADDKLRIGDRLTSVNGKAVGTWRECVAAIGANKPGTPIELEVLRGEERLTVITRLGQRPETTGEDYGEGDLSIRRAGFPNVVQHDTPLEPFEIGGPIVDSRGRIVAMNIARAGRTQTLAIPSSDLREVLERLRESMRRA